MLLTLSTLVIPDTVTLRVGAGEKLIKNQISNKSFLQLYLDTKCRETIMQMIVLILTFYLFSNLHKNWNHYFSQPLQSHVFCNKYRKLNSIISDTDHDQVSSKLTLFREQMFHKTKLIKLDGPRHNKKLDLSRVSPWNHELTLHTFPACSLYWHGCDVLLSCDFSLCYFILSWYEKYDILKPVGHFL